MSTIWGFLLKEGRAAAFSMFSFSKSLGEESIDGSSISSIRGTGGRFEEHNLLVEGAG